MKLIAALPARMSLAAVGKVLGVSSTSVLRHQSKAIAKLNAKFKPLLGTEIRVNGDLLEVWQ